MNVVENTIPVLPVADIKRSLQFYTETLGWNSAPFRETHRKSCSRR